MTSIQPKLDISILTESGLHSRLELCFVNLEGYIGDIMSILEKSEGTDGRDSNLAYAVGALSESIKRIESDIKESGKETRLKLEEIGKENAVMKTDIVGIKAEITNINNNSSKDRQSTSTWVPWAIMLVITIVNSIMAWMKH